MAPNVLGMHQSASHRALQPSFDDLGQPLCDVTFVVVDLETTGGGAEDSITEIGAVKVRGGEVLGEFQTLVRPTTHIPPMIAVLTGITNQMVAHAPRLSAVIGSFLEFADGAVLVAHNARFDIGFLKRACQSHDLSWPGAQVIDTVALARQVLLADEVRNCKLSTLAAHFHATTQPNHRALSDARATVDVLHGLIERVGSLGVSTLEDLQEFTASVSPDRRAKRVWASEVPEAPGVYWFTHAGRDESGQPRDEVLYVGKSNNLRRRVRSYFGAGETRARIHEMVRVATGVQFVTCATDLEAAVRELRLIDSHAPRYNRRSRNQHRLSWLKLTNEAFPRLSVVRQVRDDGAQYWGPFTSTESAQRAQLALYDAFPLRRCTTRLSTRRPSPRCALADMGRCPAPCELTDGVEPHARAVDAVRLAWQSDVRAVFTSVGARMRTLVDAYRFEEADELASRMRAFAAASVRHHRLRSLASCRQIVAAQRDGSGWSLHVIRYGRLAGAARTRPGESVPARAHEVVALAETVAAPVAGTPAGTIEEAELVARWLETPGVRLLDVDGDWSWPLFSGLAEADLARLLLGA